MILYSWNKVKKHSKMRIDNILYIIYYITFRPIPVTRKDKFYQLTKVDWTGSNFLLNPEPLFHRTHSPKDIAEYIALSSLRNYAEYKATNKTYIDYYRVSNRENLNKNRLLNTDSTGNIFLLYEDNLGEK